MVEPSSQRADAVDMQEGEIFLTSEIFSSSQIEFFIKSRFKCIIKIKMEPAQKHRTEEKIKKALTQ